MRNVESGNNYWRLIRKIIIPAMLTAAAFITPCLPRTRHVQWQNFTIRACTVQVNGLYLDTTIDLGNTAKNASRCCATTDMRRLPRQAPGLAARKQWDWRTNPCHKFASTAQQMIPTQRTSQKTRTKRDRKRAPRRAWHYSVNASHSDVTDVTRMMPQ